MQTTIHTYHFDVSQPDQAIAYDALCATLNDGRDRMRAWHTYDRAKGSIDTTDARLDGTIVTLETNFLFHNQWNTTGLRVFDWYEGIVPNRSLKIGHYLDITEEMRAIRRETAVCGYCGKYAPVGVHTFCPNCLDSAYLKESDLPLTRMLPVDQSWHAKRAPLTDAEKAERLPLYRDAQLHGSTDRGRARLAKQRADLEKDYTNTTHHARVKRDGFLWLLDHGINTENVIYYSHTGVFSFGWRQPVGDELRSAFLEVASEFPYPYEVKCADGRTLSAV